MKSALRIAEWFLYRNNYDDFSGESEKEEIELITNLKLQKLLYYAQGVHLAIFDKPLFEENIVAWDHGPVVKEVYEKYATLADGSPRKALGIEYKNNLDLSQFSKDELGVLDSVYEEFAQYSAWKLRNMTHEERPWKETYHNDTIDLDLIKDYFNEVYVE